MTDIASVDFPSLKRAGYNAVVIDKDNCLVRHPFPDLDQADRSDAAG
jgi:predicted HAD superfamily phosphohydrolase YqeG